MEESVFNALAEASWRIETTLEDCRAELGVETQTGWDPRDQVRQRQQDDHQPPHRGARDLGGGEVGRLPLPSAGRGLGQHHDGRELWRCSPRWWANVRRSGEAAAAELSGRAPFRGARWRLASFLHGGRRVVIAGFRPWDRRESPSRERPLRVKAGSASAGVPRPGRAPVRAPRLKRRQDQRCRAGRDRLAFGLHRRGTVVGEHVAQPVRNRRRRGRATYSAYCQSWLNCPDRFTPASGHRGAAVRPAARLQHRRPCS